MKTTRKTLVLKTVSVGGVKLPTPADRIGLGFVVLVPLYPADVLSPGQSPLPHSPGSESNPGAWQERSAAQMREQMRAGANAEPPAGPAGRPVPGSPAHRRPRSSTHPLSARGQRVAAKRPAATGRVTIAAVNTTVTTATTPAAVQCRTSVSAALRGFDRIGSDCQSPDRHDDRRPATRDAKPAAAAGK